MMKELNFALMLMKDGKLDMARDVLADLLEIDPQNRNALFHLGMCYCEMGNPEKAVRTFSECVRQHADDADAYVGLGYARSLLGQSEEARENFQKALAIDPANVYALRNLGNLYGKEEDYEKAIECLEKAFAANPQDQQTAYGLGYACFKAGRLDLAEKFLIAAVDLDRSTQIAENAMDLLRDISERL